MFRRRGVFRRHPLAAEQRPRELARHRIQLAARGGEVLAGEPDQLFRREVGLERQRELLPVLLRPETPVGADPFGKNLFQEPLVVLQREDRLGARRLRLRVALGERRQLLLEEGEPPGVLLHRLIEMNLGDLALRQVPLAALHDPGNAAQLGRDGGAALRLGAPAAVHDVGDPGGDDLAGIVVGEGIDEPRAPGELPDLLQLEQLEGDGVRHDGGVHLLVAGHLRSIESGQLLAVLGELGNAEPHGARAQVPVPCHEPVVAHVVGEVRLRAEEAGEVALGERGEIAVRASLGLRRGGGRRLRLGVGLALGLGFPGRGRRAIRGWRRRLRRGASRGEDGEERHGETAHAETSASGEARLCIRS